MSSKEAADVFQEDETGSYIAYGSCDSRPDPSLIFGGKSSSGDGYALTGKSCNHHVHHPPELGPLDSRKVSAENRRRLHGLVFHPFQEAGRGEDFPLDIHQNTGPDSEALESEFDSGIEHSDSGAKRDNCDGISHILMQG